MFGRKLEKCTGIQKIKVAMTRMTNLLAAIDIEEDNFSIYVTQMTSWFKRFLGTILRVAGRKWEGQLAFMLHCS